MTKQVNSNPIIEVKNLKKYFPVRAGNLHAVDDLSFVIPEGTTLGVVGESGCGKSTLGRTILRLHEPTSGEVYYKGTNIFKLGKGEMKALRSEMQIIFQDPYASLNPRMTVGQTISYPMEIQEKNYSSKEIDERVAEIMSLVGLAPRLLNSYPHELDGGRRQRIGIARALALDPQFIVCDEPVSALDVSIQAQILNLMQDLQDKFALTYMFITHDMSVVKHLSTNIMVMYLGKIVEFSNARRLFANPSHPYTQALLSAIPIPDPDYKSEQIMLKGEVTNPINPPPGCRFANRCRYAKEVCFKQDVELKEIEPGHHVACMLFE